MNVLFITNYPSPYRVEFFNRLGEICNLTVLFEEGIEKQVHRNKEWFNVEVEKFKAVFLKPIRIFKNNHICVDIWKYLKENKFDIIVACNYSSLTGMLAIYYMKKNRIKFAIEADGAIHKSGIGLKEKLKHYLISSANWWFSSSNLTDEYFIFYGGEKSKIYRYPFTSLINQDILEKPINADEKDTIRCKLGIKEKKVIVSVGQFIYRKGFDILINACKDIPRDVGVYIVGGKAPEEYIRRKEELKLQNVHFIDFKPKEELKQYYMASDLFVLPTRFDAWGLVINEAMAFGLPVITTDKCVAGRELIEDGINGYIVPAGCSDDLAEKINCIINNDQNRGKMALMNLYKIRWYTIENMVNVHLEIFNKILKETEK